MAIFCIFVTIMDEYRELQDIFTSFLGEPKGYITSQGQLQYNCPCCAENAGVDSDGKYNLEVNLRLGKFHCWKCGSTNSMKGNLPFLIKRYGNQTLLGRYRDVVEGMKNSGLYDLNMFTGSTFAVGEETFLELPKTFRKIDFSVNRKGKMVDYLLSRKITQETINKFNIGYTTWDEEKPIDRCRIIIPSYDENGFLNYWVGRDYTGYEKRQKYKNVDGVDKTGIVFFEDKIVWDADIVLTEGIFDALNIPNATPLLGKTLTRDNALFQSLYRKANANVIIAIDADTEISEVKRIYKQLNQGRLKGRIRYIRPQKGKDFGEVYEKYGKEGLIEELKNQNTFSEIELMI